MKIILLIYNFVLFDIDTPNTNKIKVKLQLYNYKLLFKYFCDFKWLRINCIIKKKTIKRKNGN